LRFGVNRPSEEDGDGSQRSKRRVEQVVEGGIVQPVQKKNAGTQVKLRIGSYERDSKEKQLLGNTVQVNHQEGQQ
jgi:hypothetical protein